MKEIKIGDNIGSYYRVLAIIGGEGKTGMGIIYVCYDSKFINIIALKTIQERLLSSVNIFNSFKHEGLAWVKLGEHPYIVTAYGVQKFDERLYITLEYIPPDDMGRNNLTHYLKYPISLSQALTWGIQFCFAMEHAISCDILTHRDIKPDNIMITHNQTLKITDFGLVKLLDQANPDSKNEIFQFEDPNKFNLYQNSKGRVFAGTPPWMAPEQFEGYSDIRTDIYSFGIVLFQIENHGNLPFIANTIIGFERAHHHNQVPYFESKLNSIIEKCLKKSPKDRYQNFTELRLELEEIHRKEIGENLPSIPNQKAMEYIDHHSKGYSLIRLGYNEDALDNLKKAFELNKKDFSIYINLSGAYIRNRLFEEAIVILREAINKFPPDPDFYLNLYDAYHKRAIMLDDLSQMKESKKCLDKAMKISPNNLHVLLRMVVYYVYYELNYQKALKFAKKAQKLYPNTSSVLTHLAAVYYQLNKYDESIKWYTEAIKINPNLFALDYFHLGRAYFKKNMIKQASSMFQRGLSIDPQDPEIHYYLGRFYFIQSRDLALAEKKIGKRNIELLEMAINEFKTALKIYPNYVDAQKQLSACTETRDLVKNYL